MAYLKPFRFQKLINLGRGEGGYPHGNNAGVSCSGHRATSPWSNTCAPFMGAVHVARTQGATLQIAELVEHEQRVIARFQPK